MAIEDKNINTLPDGNIEENNTVVGVNEKGFAVGYTFKKIIAWVTNELEKANLKKVEDVLTMADLRTKVGVVGQYKNLLGYYEAGDKPPLLYKWVNGVSEDDGGSAIVVGVGYWKAEFNQIVDIRDFGAKDDKYNNRDFIEKSFKLGLSVRIPKGTYKIDVPVSSVNRHGFTPSSNSEVIIEGYIKVNNNQSSHYSVFYLQDVNNLKIRGNGGIIGEIEERSDFNGEYGYGIYIGDLCYNIEISNINFQKLMGDGIVIMTEAGKQFDSENMSSDIKIHECIFDYNRRQGVSISKGHNIKIYNNSFKNTGVIKGTPPCDGIDIEPNSNEYVYNIEIYNNYFENNSGFDYQIYGKASGSRANNVVFRDNFIIAVHKPDFVSQNSIDISGNSEKGKYKNIVIKNNIILCNSVDKAIYQYRNIDDIFILGNNIKGDVTSSIYLDNFKNAVISDNIFEGSKSDNIVAKDGELLTIRGNKNTKKSFREFLGQTIVDAYILNNESTECSRVIELTLNCKNIYVKGNKSKNFIVHFLATSYNISNVYIENNYVRTISDVDIIFNFIESTGQTSSNIQVKNNDIEVNEANIGVNFLQFVYDSISVNNNYKGNIVKKYNSVESNNKNIDIYS